MPKRSLFGFFAVMVVLNLAAAGVVFILARGAISDTQWAQITLIITTLGGFALQMWREDRNRRWTQEDSARKLAEQTEEILAKARADAEAMRIATEARIAVTAMEAAAVQRQHVAQAAQALSAQIVDVHKVAAAARSGAERSFKEANDLNHKILAISDELNIKRAETNEKLERIELQLSASADAALAEIQKLDRQRLADGEIYNHDHGRDGGLPPARRDADSGGDAPGEDDQHGGVGHAVGDRPAGV